MCISYKIVNIFNSGMELSELEKKQIFSKKIANVIYFLEKEDLTNENNDV